MPAANGYLDDQLCTELEVDVSPEPQNSELLAEVESLRSRLAAEQQSAERVHTQLSAAVLEHLEDAVRLRQVLRAVREALLVRGLLLDVAKELPADLAPVLLDADSC